MTFATPVRIVVRGPRPVNTGRIRTVADEMTVGRRLHGPVTVGTRHGADAMIAGPHRHLGLAEGTIDGTTIEVVTAVIVASHPPPGGIVSLATRSRGRHPRERSPRRESARDQDRSHDYDRRRDDSRDRYRDHRR